MNDSLKTKLYAVDWHNDNEVSEFYESNRIYFDNFDNLTKEESLIDIVRFKLAYCQTLINKKHFSKSLPILEHINILVNKLKESKDFNEINNQYLFLEAIILSNLKRYQEAHENLKQLLEIDPENDYYRNWFEGNKVRLIGKKSNIYGFIGFGIIMSTYFIEPIFKINLSAVWSLFGFTLMTIGFGYPYVAKQLKKFVKP